MQTQDIILEIVYNLRTLNDVKNYCKTNKFIRNICMNNKNIILKNFIKKLFGAYNNEYHELFLLLHKLKDTKILNNSSIDISTLNWYKILNSKYNKSNEFLNYFNDYTKEFIRLLDINRKIANVIQRYKNEGYILSKAQIQNIRQNVRNNPEDFS